MRAYGPVLFQFCFLGRPLASKREKQSETAIRLFRISFYICSNLSFCFCSLPSLFEPLFPGQPFSDMGKHQHGHLPEKAGKEGDHQVIIDFVDCGFCEGCKKGHDQGHEGVSENKEPDSEIYEELGA